MTRLLLVCLGGAFGSGARYLVASWIAGTGTTWPFGTFTVNVVGSFLISVVMRLALDPAIVAPDLRLFLVTGILGGFTTYSAFNYEALALFEKGAWLAGALYAAAMLLSCLAAGLAGGWLGSRVAG